MGARARNYSSADKFNDERLISREFALMRAYTHAHDSAEIIYGAVCK